MRLASVVALLAALVARPASGASILYATAATPGRIDAFCLAGDGRLPPEPVYRTNVGDDPPQASPRRLVVANDVLYVAEIDRVEAFAIGPRGGLRRVGGTKPVQGSRPIDVLVANGMLYVAEAGAGRITAYPLDADGAPARDFTSCVMGGSDTTYQRLAMEGSFLYASAAGLPGRVEVHPIAADGSLPASGDASCRLRFEGRRPARTQPLSERGRLQNPKALVVRNGLLYVEERESKRILAFQLRDGLFEPPVQVTRRRKRFQKPLAKSARGVIYEAMTVYGESLVLTNFGKGRVDTFRLRPDGRIRKRPSARSREDVRMSPVGLVAPPDGRVVYVASGEHDRVIAFRLKRNGVLADSRPFSETDEQPGSFPNDVAVAVLPAGCG